MLTGYLSPNGLRWLSERLDSSRAVTIVTSEVDVSMTDKGNEESCREACEFLSRPNVTVVSWFKERDEAARRSRRDMHAKVFASRHTENHEPAVLVGSANLTYAGLHHNYEVVTSAGHADAQRICSDLRRVVADDDSVTDVTEEIIARLGGRAAREEWRVSLRELADPPTRRSHEPVRSIERADTTPQQSSTSAPSSSDESKHKPQPTNGDEPHIERMSDALRQFDELWSIGKREPLVVIPRVVRERSAGIPIPNAASNDAESCSTPHPSCRVLVVG